MVDPKKPTQFWFEVTCDLFFWEGNRSHCFLHWGNVRDYRFQYRVLKVTHYRSDLNVKEIVTINHAKHNPMDARSYNAMVKTVLENMRKLTPIRL